MILLPVYYFLANSYALWGLVHRLNTYPLTHAGFLHALFNILTLVPLLARFEVASGTLLTAALLAGRTLPPLHPPFPRLPASYSSLARTPRRPWRRQGPRGPRTMGTVLPEGYGDHLQGHGESTDFQEHV